jgi:hypothetical protein
MFLGKLGIFAGIRAIFDRIPDVSRKDWNICQYIMVISLWNFKNISYLSAKENATVHCRPYRYKAL